MTKCLCPLIPAVRTYHLNTIISDTLSMPIRTSHTNDRYHMYHCASQLFANIGVPAFQAVLRNLVFKCITPT